MEELVRDAKADQAEIVLQLTAFSETLKAIAVVETSKVAEKKRQIDLEMRRLEVEERRLKILEREHAINAQAVVARGEIAYDDLPTQTFV
jgi:hypothetical protein